MGRNFQQILLSTSPWKVFPHFGFLNCLVLQDCVLLLLLDTNGLIGGAWNLLANTQAPPLLPQLLHLLLHPLCIAVPLHQTLNKQMRFEMEFSNLASLGAAEVHPADPTL